MAPATAGRRTDQPGSPAPSPSARPWLQARRWLVDVAVGTAAWLVDLNYLMALRLAAADVPQARDLTGGSLVAAGCCATAAAVGFAVRRRHRHGTAVVILAAAVGIVIAGVGLAPGVMVLNGVIVYSVSSRDRWPVALPVLLVTVGWIVTGSVPIVQAGNTRIGTVGMLVLIQVLLAVLGAVTHTRRARMADLEERARSLERERDARARVAAAEERARIAREIHDIVSHSLGTMVVMADGASRLAEAEPRRAGELMGRVRDTGRDATAEMRRMLDVLRDDQAGSRLPQPGLARLDHLVDSVRAMGHRVDVTVTGGPVELGAGVDLAAYRIVQEAVTNARRHGGAMLSLIEVAVQYHEDRIELRVRDDGQGTASGPDPHRDATSSGHGLVGMRERVAAYGGTVSADDREDADGFEVVATLPYEPPTSPPDGSQR